MRAEDKIDPAAGIILHKKLGDKVSPGDALLEVHTNAAVAIAPTLHRLKQAIAIGDTAMEIPPLILKKIGA
jgi:thymidine phosphorylase